MEEGGASGREEGRRSGESDWLPNGEADQDAPKPGPKSEKTRPSKAQTAKASDAGKQRPPAKPKEKAQPAAKAKQSTQGPKVEDKAKANREELGRRQERMRMSSDVDAMGQDKHRQVIGQHKPNRGKQLLYYGVFIAFVVAAYLGLSAAVKQLDKAPAHDPATAPWAQPGAPQNPLGGFEPPRKGQKGPTHFQ